MQEAEQHPVVIIGAGITGLTLAWQLRRQGVDARVLEASDRAGGAIHTVREGEWLLETGPNTVLLKDRRVQRLIQQELGLGTEFIFANDAASKRFVVRDGIPLPLPTSIAAFVRTPLFSTRAKLRLLREPFIPRHDMARGEESAAQFVLRRLGQEFLDYAINPFIAGVYAGDPTQLSVDAAFPRLRALEQRYGSLIGGQFRGAKERRTAGRENPDRARIFSFKQGLSTLPDALAKELGDALWLNHAVSRVNLEGNIWLVHHTKRATPAHAQADPQGIRHDSQNAVLKASAVVLTVGAPQLAQIDGPWRTLDLTAIKQPPVAVVSLGYRREHVAHPLDGFGLLVPEVEQRNILGCLFPSTLFPERAPAGHVLLTCFVGGTRQPELLAQDDATLSQAVQGELEQLLGVRAEPALRYISRWQQAIPQYNLEHAAQLQALAQLEHEYPGLHLEGNYRGGIAVGDRIIAGIAATADCL